jgi:hypothetical protein
MPTRWQVDDRRDSSANRFSESEMMLTDSHLAQWNLDTPENIGFPDALEVVCDAPKEEELEDDVFFDDDEEDEDQVFLDEDDDDDDDDLFGDEVESDEEFVLELNDDEDEDDEDE